MMQLRDYQSDCLEAIKTGSERAIARQLIALPTGTGKTVIFAHLPQAFGAKNMLVLAHREELLDQAKDKISQVNPDLNVQIEQAGRRVSPSADVVVASVPTIGRKDSPRLLQFQPGEWPLIVCDEAHHSIAKSYKTVFEHFGLMQDKPSSLLVGVTATPNRGDKIGLSSVYQEITFQRNMREMILDRWLCPIHAYQVLTTTDISGVSVAKDGDFADAELSSVIDQENRNALAVNAYRNYCADRRCLVFCVDREHAVHMAQTFSRAGIECGIVLGDTPSDERHATLARLASGDLKVVANCMVLTEGYDLPPLSAIIMARPTKSELLYTQCIGRGTRIAPEKSNLIVIDLTDNSERHSLVSTPRLFGLPERFDIKGESVTAVMQSVDDLLKTFPKSSLYQARTIEEMRRIVKHFDILRFAKIDDAVAANSRLTWLPGAVGSMFDIYLRTDPPRRLSIAENLLGQFELRLVTTGFSSVESIAASESWEAALGIGDSYIQSHFPDQMGLLRQDTRWRQPAILATESQKSVLRGRGIPFSETISKGEASNIITRLLSQ